MTALSKEKKNFHYKGSLSGIKKEEKRQSSMHNEQSHPCWTTKKSVALNKTQTLETQSQTSLKVGKMWVLGPSSTRSNRYYSLFPLFIFFASS